MALWWAAWDSSSGESIRDARAERWAKDRRGALADVPAVPGHGRDSLNRLRLQQEPSLTRPEPHHSPCAQSGKSKQIYRGHLGPVTSLDFYTSPSINGKPGRELLISGSWDKSFRVWDTKVRRSLSSLEKGNRSRAYAPHRPRHTFRPPSRTPTS